MYAVDIQITAPGGRSTTNTGYFAGSGTVSNSTLLNVIEEGDYLISTTHRGFCNQAYVEFELASWTQTQRPPACTPTTATCADGNSENPVGDMKSNSCQYYDGCCKSGGNAAPGYCRKEVCKKCPGYPIDPQPSQCQSKSACELTVWTLCFPSTNCP